VHSGRAIVSGPGGAAFSLRVWIASDKNPQAEACATKTAPHCFFIELSTAKNANIPLAAINSSHAQPGAIHFFPCGGRMQASARIAVR